MKKIIDFVNITGKNIGKIQNTKLAKHLDYSEGSLRNLEANHPKRYKALTLGAFCTANNISKEDLLTLLR